MKVAAVALALVVSALVSQADPRQWPVPGLPLRQTNNVELWVAGQTASDAEGRTVFVWTDERDGGRSVYAQAADLGGHLLWPLGGVGICTEPHAQYLPMVTATQDGFIVAWIDYRSDPYDYQNQREGGDVRTQKISIAGDLQWSTDNGTGVPVDITNSEILNLIGAYDDREGGAMIVWRDRTFADGTRISVQRLNSSGELVYPQPVHFAADPTDGWVVNACSDDSGGVYVVFGLGANTRVNRVTCDGWQPWGESGIVAFSFVRLFWIPQVSADGLGGCCMTIRDSSVPSRMQRVSRAGDLMWGPSGLIPPLRSAASDVMIAPSVDGGSVDGYLLASCMTTPDFASLAYVQKVNLAGEGVWGESGTLVCDNAGTSDDVEIASDSSGGAVIARWDYHSNGRVSGCKVSRFGPRGNSIWSSCEPVAISGPSVHPVSRPIVHARAQRILASGTEPAGDYSDGGLNIRYQALDLSTGANLLADSGGAFVVDIGGSASVSTAMSLSSGRALICWNDNRGVNERARYQIVHPDGSAERTSAGERVITFPDTVRTSYVQSSCPDGTGGAFLAVAVGTNGQNWGALTRIDRTGERVGPDDGVTFTTGDGTEDLGELMLVSDGGTGCFVGWDVYAAGHYFSLQHYSDNLAPLWTSPLVMYNASVGWILPSTDGTCILIGATGTSSQSIWARKVDSQGQTAWNTTFLQGIISNVWGMKVTADRDGGFYWAENDQRFSGANSADLFAGHMTSDGVVSWTPNGITVMRRNGRHYINNVAVDLDNNLYVVWEDAESPSNPQIHLDAQRIRPDSTLCWPDTGVFLGSYFSADGGAAATVDAHGHFTLATLAFVSNYEDEHLRGLQLDSLGQPTDPYWSAGAGNLIADTLSRTNNPKLVADSGGGVFVIFDRYPTGGSPTGTYSVFGQFLLDHVLSAPPEHSEPPAQFALYPPSPNPFNPSTEIRFQLARAGRVELTVYNISGQVVARLLDDVRPAGEYRVTWDGRSGSEMPVSSGMYICKMKAGPFNAVRKMLLIR